jgi:UDP-N-acetylglucosamine--N-acetylmuramyl-(pentapeptide) pyrophosphoryl-undecaprenol N-acetylglucosamine transferase
VIHTGNPVRKAPELYIGSSKEDEEFLALPEANRLIILVTGGSQGAHSINKAFIEAVKLLDSPKEIFIIHQTGRDDEEWIRNEYQRMGIDGLAKAFFHQMPRYQDMADLVICRSGAGTLSELTLKGLPAILSPFPFAADDHQTANAKTLVDQNAAVMIPDADLTPLLLLETITALKNDPEALSKMGRASKALAMEHADERIARELIQLTENRG